MSTPLFNMLKKTDKNLSKLAKLWYTILKSSTAFPEIPDDIKRSDVMNTIITIGRQYGSGGREIGQKLADYYGIPFYDKELLKVAAKESGICEEMFENYDEKPTTSFLYSLVMDPYALG